MRAWSASPPARSSWPKASLMLLAIDAGNTNIVFAVYDGDKIVAQWRAVDQDVAHRRRIWRLARPSCSRWKACRFADLDAAIIASVVPEALFDLRDALPPLSAMRAARGRRSGGRLGSEDQLSTGPRRSAPTGCANAVAAHARYQGALIVVDFGTATTFDIVTEDGDYDGGVIAPGVNLSVEALHQAAALLPRVAIHRAQNVIGKDTVPAMQSGIYWGYVGLIEGLVDAHQGRIRQAHDGHRHRRAASICSAPDCGDRACRSRPDDPRAHADLRPQPGAGKPRPPQAERQIEALLHQAWLNTAQPERTGLPASGRVRARSA